MHSASMLLAVLLAGLSATAQASHYASGFHLDGWLPPLRTGTGIDGPDTLPGAWNPPRTGTRASRPRCAHVRSTAPRSTR